MLANAGPWPGLLLLLVLLPALISSQIETQDVDLPDIFECVAGNVAGTSRRAAAGQGEVPSVVPAAVVQATAAALQTAGVKVNNMLQICFGRSTVGSPRTSDGSLPENETSNAGLVARHCVTISSLNGIW
jgi:hypothetical protein